LDISVGVPEFLAAPLLTGPVYLLSQGRFAEPARPLIIIQTEHDVAVVDITIITPNAEPAYHKYYGKRE